MLLKKGFNKFLQPDRITWLMLGSLALFYVSFAYDLHRTEFLKLLLLYTGLFFLSWKILELKRYNFWFLAAIALVFRLVFFLAIPNLSQDFYRFIWDGRMLIAGYNPFLSLPAAWISAGNSPIAQAGELYEGMGELSAGNHTNYPPLNQLIFALTALLAGNSILGSVLVMRCIIIVADLGILCIGRKLLEKLGLPEHRIYWYILNPFVIIELTGNLHFEGVMLFFLIGSLYMLHQRKWVLSAGLFALSVLLKLLPLLFLPLFAKFFKKGKTAAGPAGINFTRLISFYLVVGVWVIAGFLPFISDAFIDNFTGSIGLWFQKFEFNASIYYIVRWVGYQVTGYNIITIAGKVLPLVILLILGGVSLFRKNYPLQALITAMMIGVSGYLFLSTTVHPWYIATPLVLSIFTRYRFALIWSFLGILSYHAYSQPGFEENLWFVAIEYFVVIGVFLIELFREDKRVLFYATECFKRYKFRA